MEGVSPVVRRVLRAELDERLAGYPPLAERREIARRSQRQLAALVPVFEAGNYLMLTGHYAQAARAFDYIARTFPSREVLNNNGAARALEALEKSGEIAFAYPFELDARTRRLVAIGALAVLGLRARRQDPGGSPRGGPVEAGGPAE